MDVAPTVFCWDESPLVRRTEVSSPGSMEKAGGGPWAGTGVTIDYQESPRVPNLFGVPSTSTHLGSDNNPFVTPGRQLDL